MLLVQRMQARASLHASRLISTPDRIGSCSTCACRVARLHTSSRREDHYQTLEVAKGASQQDIKAQFYKLSKKWHPDVNPDSENAVQKFQEVSEAYHTLGTETSRKDYDRSMTATKYGAARSGSRGQYRYTSDNVARRASASYAWDYQRRRSPPRSSSTSANSSSSASQGRSQYNAFGSGGASSSSTTGSSSMFEQFAQRERRKEAAAAARSTEAGKSPAERGAFSSKEEYEAHSASPIIRFAQVAGLFYIVFYLGTKLGSTNEPKRTNGR